LHGDLGPGAGIAGSAPNLDHLLSNLRHLDGEQLHQHFIAGTAENQLGSTGFGTDIDQNRTDPVVDTENFTSNQLFTGQHGLGIVPEIDNKVFARHFLDSATHQLAYAIAILVGNEGALGVAHLLHDHLLGGLRGNATEIDVFDTFFKDVTGLEVGV